MLRMAESADPPVRLRTIENTTVGVATRQQNACSGRSVTSSAADHLDAANRRTAFEAGSVRD
jgi:hypothetical protein